MLVLADRSVLGKAYRYVEIKSRATDVSRMRPMTATDQQLFEAELSSMQPMRCFSEKLRTAWVAFGNHTLTSPHGKSFRESTTALELGAALRATHVRLVPETRPDFELRISEATQAFEATDVDAADRRRGDEYKALRRLPNAGGMHITHLPCTHTPSDPEIAAKVAAAAINKAKMGYCKDIGLVIQVNFFNFRTM